MGLNLYGCIRFLLIDSAKVVNSADFIPKWLNLFIKIIFVKIFFNDGFAK